MTSYYPNVKHSHNQLIPNLVALPICHLPASVGSPGFIYNFIFYFFVAHLLGVITAVAHCGKFSQKLQDECLIMWLEQHSWRLGLRQCFFLVAMLYLWSSSFCFPPYLSPLSLLNSFTIESDDILCFSYQKSYNVRLSLNTNIWASLPVHLVHKCVTFI